MAQKYQQQILLAQAAAKIIAEEGISNRDKAAQKAAMRLGIKCQPAQLPKQDMVEEALAEYLRIYYPDKQQQPGPLHDMRQIALEAMHFLAEYSPILVGALHEGHANRHTPITLQIYPDTAEEALFKLQSADIPYEIDSHSVKTGKPSRIMSLPLIKFLADEYPIHIKLFPKTIYRSKMLAADRANSTTIHSLEKLLVESN